MSSGLVSIPRTLGALVLLALSRPLPAADSAVILLYHHVADDTPASTSVTPAEFAGQLDYLVAEGMKVLPLLELLQALRAGQAVPEGSVAITFDDGYRSILSGALPELRARNMPFTVFVNTESIDQDYSAYLGWEELRSLGAHQGTIGNHSVSHEHLVRRHDGESQADWQRRIRAEITGAGERLAAEVADQAIPVFAYPYGEYTAEIKAIVADLGLIGLGQQSGAIGPGSDFLALPRYPIAAANGLTAAEFALRVRSRPLPVRQLGPEEHIVGADDRPELHLAIESATDLRLGEFACFAPGQGRMQLAWQDEAMTELKVRPERPLGPGRSKYNCTVPSSTLSGVYYWFGYLWMKRQQDGSWYDE